MKYRLLSTTTLGALLALGLMGCERDSATENAVEDMEDAAEEAQEDAEDAMEDAGDAIEDAGDEIDDTVDGN